MYQLGDPGDGLYRVISGDVRLVSYPMSQAVLAGRIGVSRQQRNTLLGGLKRRGYQKSAPLGE
jgi:CRP-like cAMP-binding protein